MRALLCFLLVLGAVCALECPQQYDLMEGRCIRVLVLNTGDHGIIIDNEIPGYRAECAKDNAHLPIIKNDEDNTFFDNVIESLEGIRTNAYILLGNISLTSGLHPAFGGVLPARYAIPYFAIGVSSLMTSSVTNGGTLRFITIRYVGGSGPYADLDCNTSTHRLQWVDGSTASYSRRNSVNYDFDCVSTHQTAVSRPLADDWFLFATNELQNWYTIMCQYDGWSPTTVKPASPTTSTTTIRTSTPPHPTIPTTSKTTSSPASTQCGDYSLIDISTDGQPCIKVNKSPLSWNNAQIECAGGFGSLLTINSVEENKYFWRTAISNGILDGMHIGAHLSNNSQWTWEDGEVAIDGKSYNNFAPFFPLPGAGDCASMATENSAAFWVNENCDNNEQPFICRRSDYSSIPASCPAVSPKAGDDIFPPGFPNSDISCEYYLFVSPGKQVELEVLTLIAEENKDYLEILEGSSGPHLIANLTGTVLSTKFTTVESNVLRVNWKPNGSGSGRGFRIRYNEFVA